ncbi:MAG: hypothetical protein E3J21_24515 [Anaerolineales bacterium]|nr:MAG: hypothetical protein E3J21_24515 [Anaerolineales bacterium]
MAATKTTINAFESQLAIALKAASITAAANVIQSNPDMTLEDLYAILRPQGVTESITLAEIINAMSGEPVVVTTAQVRAGRPRATPSAAPAKPKKPRKPSRVPEVNCMTKAGQEAYHRAILEYLAGVDDWVRSPDVTAFCGGDKSQIGTAMRKHLIPSGLVKSKGKTFGLHFAITSKGKRKAAGGSAVTATRSAPGVTRRQKNGIGDSSRTHAARDAYRATILKFLHGSKWRAGPEISAACGGGAPARRKRALKHMIEEGVVESNGKLTGAVRFRLARK